MNKDTIILTRRIQLLVNSKDKEVIKESYQKLYDWRYACFRAANYIFTHLYLQEQIKDLFYLEEDIRVKLVDRAKNESGIFKLSRMGTIYQVLSKNFKGEVPMAILSNLNTVLFKNFNNERLSYLKGERTLRNYKREIPIPFAGKEVRNWQVTEDERNYTCTLFGIPFRTYLGRDFSDKKVLLDKMMAGVIPFCSGSIQLKDNKIFLLAAFRLEKEKHSLNDSVIAEASLSIDYPVTVTIGKSHYNIGSKDEFLYRRLAIQAAKRRVAKAVSYNRGGKGRGKKLKALDRFAEVEKNYVTNRLHLYSRKLIDICTRHGAGTLILAGQQDKQEAAKEDGFLLRNWSYYELKEKISYKARKAGITIIEE
jgi:IS605 OrfB family transposase